jgi:hypothetical protein
MPKTGGQFSLHVGGATYGATYNKPAHFDVSQVCQTTVSFSNLTYAVELFYHNVRHRA